MEIRNAEHYPDPTAAPAEYGPDSGMTAREFLTASRKTRIHIALLNRRLADMEQRITDIASAPPDRIRSAPSEDRLCRDVAAIADLKAELRTIRDRLCVQRREAVETINRVPVDADRVLLTLRYLCDMTWPRVAREMFVSEKYVYTLHRRALIRYAKVNGFHRPW